MKKRKEFLDIARGISMICIVLGHLGISNINRVVYTFHLPIFYFISGYFIDEKSDFKEFVRKKWKVLIKPYYITCFVICILALLKAIIRDENIWKTLVKWLYASLYGAGDSYSSPFYIKAIGAIWFLWAAFWSNCFLKWLLKKSDLQRFVMIIIIFIISCSSRSIIWLPLSIQAGGCALLFMYLGYLFRKNVSMIETMGKEVRLLIMTSLICVWIWCMINFKAFWLVHCEIGNGVIDIIGSIGGCLVLLGISKLIEKYSQILKNIFAFLGRYSLIFLCVHDIELNLVSWTNVYNKLFGGIGINYEMLFMGVLLVMRILLILLCTYIITKIKILRRLFGY